jgi:Ca2+-binding EF-hand superfamily protein
MAGVAFAAGEGEKRGPRDTGGPKAEGGRRAISKAGWLARKAQRVFKAYDKNKDGKVVLAEFLAMKEGAMAGARKAREEKYFAAIDTGNDGSLSLAEFTAWRTGKVKLTEGPPKTGPRDTGGPKAEGGGVVAPRSTPVARKAKGAFMSYDKNKDGKVAFEEFLRMKEGAMTADRKAREKKHFDAIDTGNDGSISLAEFTAWRTGAVTLTEGPPKTGPRDTGAPAKEGGDGAAEVMNPFDD